MTKNIIKFCNIFKIIARENEREGGKRGKEERERGKEKGREREREREIFLLPCYIVE